MTQPTELVSVKTLCKGSGFCTTDFNRNALGKDHRPSAVLGGDAEYLSAEEAMQNNFVKHTADVLGYLADTSMRRIQLVNSRDVPLVAGSLRSSSWLGCSHQHLMAFAAIAQDSGQA